VLDGTAPVPDADPSVDGVPEPEPVPEPVPDSEPVLPPDGVVLLLPEPPVTAPGAVLEVACAARAL
jgi:hypothetical protein